MSAIKEMITHFADACRLIEINIHLDLGIRDVKCAPLIVSDSRLPPVTINGNYRISDEEVREWEERTGRCFLERKKEGGKS